MDSTNSIDDKDASLPRGISFARPTVWNPSDSSVVRWVNDQSAPAQREQPLPPAPFRAPSRLVPIVDAKGDDGNVETKSGRRLSITTVRSALDKKRNSVVVPGQGITDKVSTMYHRVFAPGEAGAMEPSGALKSSQSSLISSKDDGPIPSMRFIFVGDSGCGKSALLMRSYRGTFIDGLEKTKLESFIKKLGVLASYLAFDAVFLCFALDNTAGFVEAQNKWVDYIQANCPNTPIILLGLKKDTCFGPGMRAPKIHPHLFSSIRTPQNIRGSMDSDTQIVRSVKYIECSAKTGYNVERVLQEGAKLVLAERAEQIDLARIREEVEESGVEEKIKDIEQKSAAEPVEKAPKGISKFSWFKKLM
ncbi:P-loop containing nucleoside triphosphate hydrolase protein [Annulohypoxylon truncatum]|uniref:P-loop containing nucleoside triphosphate hydrolase protein n=1 Tax=Annulohypoxylon truncatum TaxID=327061 RepID=UPI0020076A2D|nr:P-loop containing nucleoside triphosphate hydrolase protein [Annulohypoxylon truncatum]KAI1206273.1 P-loop containing nucleoside triphosphate hydrolase protein [Annulohypoxylon truncatum]